MFSKLSEQNNKPYSFTPPVVRGGKEHYVSFYAFDPASGKMKRKKYMLDRYKSGKTRTMMASQLIANLTAKLLNGWNPWVSNPSTKGDILLVKVLDNYEVYIKKERERNVLKEKTFIDWKSRLGILRAYLSEYHKENTMAYQLDSSFCVGYLDYVLLDRDVSARTRNNHRGWLSTVCSWMVERGYIQKNPVADISAMPEHEKFREALPPSALHRLRQWCEENDRNLLLAVMMEYYTFIRPVELMQIRLKDISIENQTVFVSGEISKNRHDGLVALNDSILKLMIELRVFDNPSHYYLFGKNLRPSEKMAGINMFRNHFVKARKALHFPDTYQFYSLKDSGIRDLANAEGIVNARNQARHTDVSTTNRYLAGKNQPINEGTKHFVGEL